MQKLIDAMFPALIVAGFVGMLALFAGMQFHMGHVFAGVMTAGLAVAFGACGVMLAVDTYK